MRRVVCRSFAPVEHLEVEDGPDPRPQPGEVVVAVRAAGVNFVDVLLVQGLYQIKPPLPFTPGGEIAGEVVELGAEVEDFSIGERVVVSCGLGGFVDRLAVPALLARRLPASLSFEKGALVQSYATARRPAVPPPVWQDRPSTLSRTRYAPVLRPAAYPECCAALRS